MRFAKLTLSMKASLRSGTIYASKGSHCHFRLSFLGFPFEGGDAYSHDRSNEEQLTKHCWSRDEKLSAITIPIVNEVRDFGHISYNYKFCKMITEEVFCAEACCCPQGECCVGTKAPSTDRLQR